MKNIKRPCRFWWYFSLEPTRSFYIFHWNLHGLFIFFTGTYTVFLYFSPEPTRSFYIFHQNLHGLFIFFTGTYTVFLYFSLEPTRSFYIFHRNLLNISSHQSHVMKAYQYWGQERSLEGKRHRDMVWYMYHVWFITQVCMVYNSGMYGL